MVNSKLSVLLLFKTKRRRTFSVKLAGHLEARHVCRAAVAAQVQLARPPNVLLAPKRLPSLVDWKTRSGGKRKKEKKVASGHPDLDLAEGCRRSLFELHGERELGKRRLPPRTRVDKCRRPTTSQLRRASAELRNSSLPRH